MNPDSPDSPRVTAFHGVILCALAAILFYFCCWSSDSRITEKAAPASKNCAYQVYQDDRCLGTVFLNGPTALPDILGSLGIRDRSGTPHTDEKLPCNCAVRFRGSSPAWHAEKIAGRHLLAAGLHIDINLADEKDLMALPGIGPALAARIVEQREARGYFRDVRDLLNVPGIGKKRLSALEPFVEVKPISGSPQASESPGPAGSPSPSTLDP